jgi:hypothetical protein
MDVSDLVLDEAECSGGGHTDEDDDDTESSCSLKDFVVSAEENTNEGPSFYRAVDNGHASHENNSLSASDSADKESGE